jgi:hypothetical protein
MRKMVSLSICLLLLTSVAAAVPSAYAATDAVLQSSSPAVAATESCGEIPDDVSGSITPQCGQQNTEVTVEVAGFTSKEPLGYWLDGDYGIITGTSRPAAVDEDGKFDLSFYPYELGLKPGLYYWVFRGLHSRHEAIVYFRVIEEATPKDSCSSLPAVVSGNITPRCGGWYTEFALTVWDFRPNEPIGYYLDGDHGVIPGTKLHTYAGPEGSLGNVAFHTYDFALEPGLYYWVFQGEKSGHQAILYFRVGEEVATPDQSCGRIAAPQHGKMSPWCGGQDTTFTMEIWGFLPYEPVGYWLNGESGIIFGTENATPIGGTGSEVITFKPADYGLTPGLYFWVFQGVNSGHQSIIYFRVR